ncbi:alpha/beta hydrolase [Algoriphagus kandeliae]|uniref:Alpha/beta hydrolase n=1 Tax=Algoriphagus kandeliae TaxID=2562278 RepID=A0A4Y9QR53_9BACT|nr:alpha/beta hydrolase [Algoriphagus kandeliae]TFV94268.1 alpha/beta hydrolase [Algoriphagus kandeliae]
MKFIQNPSGKLHYQTVGDGEETVLLLHGFGQSMEDLKAFSRIRKPNQRYIYIDIFYHGRSQWFDSKKPLSKNTWKAFIQKLRQEVGFQNFHLIGYSMGGKFALLTYELFDSQVQSLTLLAPDGIKTGLWYSISSYPGSFHGLFKGVVFKPHLFFGLMNGLNSAGLLESSIVKFVQTQMETRSKRAQVYFTWRVFGGIHLHLGKIIRQARKNKTPIKLFIGEYDKMITHENLNRFSSKIPQIQEVILPVGHGQLIEKTVEYLEKESS